VPHENWTRNAYQIGVVYGQRSQLDWDLPLIDSFDILAAMYKLPRQRYRDQLAFLVDLMDMAEFLDQVGQVSLSQVPLALVVQIVWLVILAAGSRRLYASAMKKLAVQGG
jgi:ABC-type uncharacterized transport system ATPase subunit